jgi:Tfp pilus assembly protein PilN
MTLWPELNLARRPFTNRRPALRLAILLWIVGVGLAAANLALYLQHLPGASLTPEQQRIVHADISRERAAIGALRRELAGSDVEQINQVAGFVNTRIAARAFAWSALFDHVAEALPGPVRLLSLEPGVEKQGRGGAGSPATAGPSGRVRLEIRGVARSSEDLLEFVDRLFVHEQFGSPDLISERTLDSGEREFALSVSYDPPARSPEASSGQAAASDAPPADEPAGVEASPLPEARPVEGGEAP